MGDADNCWSIEMSTLTSDEAAGDEARCTASHCHALDDDTDDEDADIHKDSVFAREDFSKEAAVQATKPSTELEDGGQPALFRRIANPIAHIWNGSVGGCCEITKREDIHTSAEGLHGKDS